MKQKFLAIYNLEKAIWGEKSNPNKYLTMLTVLFAALLGAYLAGGEYLNDLLNWHITTPTLTASIGMLIALIGYNIAESIIVTETAKVAILRALMMSAFVIAGFIVGAIASVVVLFIITAIIVIFLFITFLKFMLGVGSSEGNRKFTLENGDEVTEHRGFMGEKIYTGVLGKTYSTDDGGKTFTED